MLTLFLSGTHPEAELLYHVVVLVLIFFKKMCFLAVLGLHCGAQALCGGAEA